MPVLLMKRHVRFMNSHDLPAAISNELRKLENRIRARFLPLRRVCRYLQNLRRISFNDMVIYD
jgi:hypothetical protein